MYQYQSPKVRVRSSQTRTRQYDWFEREQEQRFYREAREQVDHWKSASVDCMQIFANALIIMPQLLRPKNELKEMLNEIIQEEVAPKAVNKPRLTLLYECETGRRREVIEVVTAQKTTRDSDILVHGRDPEIIDLVVQAALKDTVMSVKELATIRLSGSKIGNRTSEGYREILSFEFKKHESPKRVFIILEEFTFSMLSNFRRSGFVNANRMRGIQINTIICWTYKHRSVVDARVFSEFARKVFVPSGRKEEERVSGNDSHAREVDDMVIHKPIVPSTDGDERDKAVEKFPMRDKAVQEIERRCCKNCSKVDENLQGSYAELQPIRNYTESIANHRHANTGQTEASIISNREPELVLNNGVTYAEMHSVTKQPSRTKPISAEPHPNTSQERSSSERIVDWSKKKSASVSINMENHGDAEDGRGKGKETMLDECKCNMEEGPFGKVLKCFVSAWACFLD